MYKINETLSPWKKFGKIIARRKEKETPSLLLKRISKGTKKDEPCYFSHSYFSFLLTRSWRTNLPKGACVLVSTSVEHDDAPLIGGVRGTVLASRFLIEPSGSGKSRLTYICRIDTKGRTTEWYNKAYGHIVAGLIGRIRTMYQHGADGPETKV